MKAAGCDVDVAARPRPGAEKQPADQRLTYCHPRAFAPGTVFSWVGQDLLHFRLAHAVVVDVRRASLGIDVETEFHALGW